MRSKRKPGDDPRGLDGGADVECEVQGDVVDVLGQRHVRVVGEPRLVVEGAGTDLLGEVGAVGCAFGERHECDVGDGAEGVRCRTG